VTGCPSEADDHATVLHAAIWIQQASANGAYIYPFRLRAKCVEPTHRERLDVVVQKDENVTIGAVRGCVVERRPVEGRVFSDDLHVGPGAQPFQQRRRFGLHRSVVHEDVGWSDSYCRPVDGVDACTKESGFVSEGDNDVHRAKGANGAPNSEGVGCSAGGDLGARSLTGQREDDVSHAFGRIDCHMGTSNASMTKDLRDMQDCTRHLARSQGEIVL
jgi:hypothetical protein